MPGALFLAATTLILAIFEAPFIAFAAVIGTVFLWYIVAKTAWELADFTLAAIVYLTLFNISDLREAGSVRVADVRLAAEAVAVLAIMYKKRLSIVRFFQAQPALMLFGMWVLIAAPLGEAPMRSALYASWFLVSVAFLLAFALIAPDMRTALGSAARAMVLGYGLALLPSLWMMLRDPSVLTTTFHSPIGMRHVPAQGAGIFIIALLYLRVHYRWRGVMWNATVASMVSIAAIIAFTSLNRVSWIGVALALAGFILGRREHMLRDITALGIATAMFMVISARGPVEIMRHLPEAAQTRWIQTTESSEAVLEAQWSETDERVFVWRDKLGYLADHPFAGAGIINSTLASSGAAPGDMNTFSAHSTFIGVLVETGWIGTVVFVAFLMNVITRAITLYSRGKEFHYLLFLLLTSFGISLFEYNLSPGQATFWPFFTALVLLGARRGWPPGMLAARYTPPAVRPALVPLPQQAMRPT